MGKNIDHNAISAGYEIHRELLATWLSRLFLCQIAAIAVSALSAISAISAVTGWVTRIISVVSIVIFFKLSPVNGRYRKAAIFRCIVIGGGILSLLLQSSILTLAWTVCTLIAQYQEYSAHSDLTAAKDPKLSRNWHSLFNWQIFGGVIAAAASVFAVLAGVLIGMESDTIISVTLGAVNAVTLILEIVYLIYLRKTLNLYRI